MAVEKKVDMTERGFQVVRQHPKSSKYVRQI
jgi:hypothetical protein